jgi:hypothetical protein
VISASSARAEDCAAAADAARRNADKQVKAGEAKAAVADLTAVKEPGRQPRDLERLFRRDRVE